MQSLPDCHGAKTKVIPRLKFLGGSPVTPPQLNSVKLAASTGAFYYVLFFYSEGLCVLLMAAGEERNSLNKRQPYKSVSRKNPLPQSEPNLGALRYIFDRYSSV